MTLETENQKENQWNKSSLILTKLQRDWQNKPIVIHCICVYLLNDFNNYICDTLCMYFTLETLSNYVLNMYHTVERRIRETWGCWFKIRRKFDFSHNS